MEMNFTDPQFQLATRICHELQARGFSAYFAGGCVRDFLLKMQPNDFDVATNATPDDVEKIFPKTVAVGKKFGVIVVVDGDEQVEVATFRKDGGYQDGRRPDNVEFCGAKEDALRRDFTVNALFYDLKNRQIIDYVDGERDLKNKLLRAVGDPVIRFEEDHLRILRGIRFSAQLGFEIEPLTLSASKKLAAQVTTVSGERIQEELTKFLRSPFLEKGLLNLFESGVLGELLGEKPLVWHAPKVYFEDFNNSSDDLWFSFFQWIYFSFREPSSLFFFEGLCDQWKFSRDLKNKTLKSLCWFYEDKPFLKRSLGELLALSYEPAHDRGLKSYGRFLLKDEERVSFDRFIQRKSLLGAKKPEAWVQSADLMPLVSGEELGRALKLCYYEQLLGQKKSKEDLIAWWKSGRGTEDGNK